MSFALFHIRHRPHEQCPLMVLSSESHHFQPAHTEAAARLYITNCSRNSDSPYFVVIFGADNLPREAHAVRRGQWRDLELVKASPLPADLRTLNLYPGTDAISPYIVTRW